jgi:hypothetical protein
MILSSCKKSETPTLESFLQWHQSQNLDSIGVANKLTGNWILSGRFCFKDTTLFPAPLVKLSFNPNGSYTVYYNSVINNSGNWSLTPRGVNMWGLSVSSPSPVLNGRIVFRENEIMFDSTYVNGEGCYNIFKN